MTFSKRFPRTVEGSTYPKWEDITLSNEEEAAEEGRAREQNISLLKECIDDAKAIAAEKNLKPYETSIVRMAVTLFDKRASHTVYHKEKKAKEKFDSQSST